MFKDFFEDGLFKKTTKEEKKEVVKNTGDWFPEQHDNKIKGMDNVVANYSHNGAEQHKEARAGYTIKKCAVCGKEFESYRNVAKYCKECVHEENLKVARERKRKAYEEKKAEEARIRTNAYKRARERGTTYEYELLKIKKGIDPLRAPNRKCKDEAEKKKRTKEWQKNYRKNNNVVMTPVGEADLHMRECASKRASIRGTEYLDELKKIIDGVEPIRDRSGNPNFTHKTTVVETKVKAEPKPQEPQVVLPKAMRVTDEAIELEALEIAINIVRRARAEEDVKLAVDATHKIIRELLAK